MPGLLSTADSWVFNLRECAHDSDEYEDEDEDHANTKKGSDSDLLRTMDLSSREDAAHYKPNPWAIAKLNAVSRPPPTNLERKAGTGVSQSKKGAKVKQRTIAEAFSKQAAQGRQSPKRCTTPGSKIIGKTAGSNVNYGGVGKAEARLFDTDAKGFRIISASPNEPITCSSKFPMVSPGSANEPKLSVDVSSLGIEASSPSRASSQRPLQTKILGSSSTPNKITLSRLSYQNSSNARPIPSAHDICLVTDTDTDTDHLDHPVLNNTPPVPLSQVIAASCSDTVGDPYDESLQAPDPDSTRTSLRRSMIEMNSREIHRLSLSTLK
ncbi:hypothetical protein JB92DRAFT_2004018 [Gautieria morchelliformis]|nr:hypothetical protein JB92DRAFT_2004018 [Gautieria morchelliformis]